ncbi:membrane progestin receptor alpha isoform X3 [Tyto alba]|uniref:membrane progestin receptor alpha isoform X3 n=1 Tax=Tyto alba TaxID=56313 RepID=UPI001C6682A7|nr:membrane progestin receptor alpha isoform X3 [Tyto alba]
MSLVLQPCTRTRAVKGRWKLPGLAAKVSHSQGESIHSSSGKQALHADGSLPATHQTNHHLHLLQLADRDEKDKENFRPSPFIPNKGCKGKGVSSAAFPVKILALPQMEEAWKESFRVGALVQVTPRRRAREAPASPTPLPDSRSLQAASHGQSEASGGAGEDWCCFSFTQDSEGSRDITHRTEPDFLAGETVSASGSVRSACGVSEQEGPLRPETRLRLQPGLGANQREKPRRSGRVNSLIDFSETENINPTLTRASPWAAGLCSSPERAAGAQPPSSAEGGDGQGGASSPCRQLFTQDSEGNRVIAHRCCNAPTARGAGGCSGRRLLSSPCTGCARAAARSWSEAGQQRLDKCYESLFTQDSEGNRVIKH